MDRGYKLFKKPGFAAETPEGQDLLRQMLGGSGVESFHFSIPAGSDRQPDSHSVDAVAYIKSGILRIRFGGNYSDIVIAEGGDFLFIAKNTPHKESTGPEQGVALELYYTGDFQVFAVG